jgi:transcriptional regulator GlxA family with amidase domain
MKIAIAAYERMTLLDAVGPYSVLAHVPGADVTFVARTTDALRVDVGKPRLVPDAAYSDLPDPDVIVVPGGPDRDGIAGDGVLHEWLVAAAPGATWVTSVCTGAYALGAAGLLRGKRATTHWSALEGLATFGATPVSERVVEEGRVITAAGVSAGIDMGLTLAAKLAGALVAQAIQLGIEYDPQPPFSSGSPRTAPPEVLALLESRRTAASA